MSEISEQLDKLISLSEQIVENTIPEADKRAAAAAAAAQVAADKRAAAARPSHSEAAAVRRAQRKALADGHGTGSPTARLRTGPVDGNLSISATRSKLNIDQLDGEFDKFRRDPQLKGTYLEDSTSIKLRDYHDKRAAIARAKIDVEIDEAKYPPMPAPKGGRKKKSRRTRRKKRRTKKRRTRRTKRRT